MPTDKIIKIDLNALTEKGLGELIKVKQEIVSNLEKSGKRTKKTSLNEFQRSDEKTDKIYAKLKKQLEFDLVNGKGKDTLKKKLFGNFDFSKGGIGKNIVGFGLNPQGFMGGLFTKGIPGFGAAVAATAVIGKILKKFDSLEKRFTDDIRTKLNAERDNETTARIQAGIAQEIFSAGPGMTDPRDTYNTNDEFNTNQPRIETDYLIRSTQGIE